MTDLLLPRTDAGVLGQLIAVTLLLVTIAVLARQHRELLTLVAGVAVMTAALFALRTLH